MRAGGLDEYRVAGLFAAVVEGLTGKQSDAVTSVQKLLVDVLKECCRHLDPPGVAGRVESEGPRPIILVHQVDRPVREANPDDGTEEAP